MIQGDCVRAPQPVCFVSCPWAGLQLLLDSLSGPVWFQHCRVYLRSHLQSLEPPLLLFFLMRSYDIMSPEKDFSQLVSCADVGFES